MSTFDLRNLLVRFPMELLGGTKWESMGDSCAQTVNQSFKA